MISKPFLFSGVKVIAVTGKRHHNTLSNPLFTVKPSKFQYAGSVAIAN
jgi:hypothetical protein